jgi:hypothetical protein
MANISKAIVAEGISGFVHIAYPDNYKGTEKYKITLTLDKKNAEIFKKAGVNLKEYNGEPQVSMSRKLDFGQPPVFDADGERIPASELSQFGDLVRVVAKAGKGDYSQYAYVDKIKLLQKNEEAGELDEAGAF